MISAKDILTNNVNHKYINNNVKNINKNNVNKLNNNVNNIYNNDANKKVDYIANNLVEKLKSPQSYKLFCKIAYQNSEPIISRCLGLTLENNNVRNKGGYFVSLIKELGTYN